MNDWAKIIAYFCVTAAGIILNYLFMSWKLSMKVAEEVGTYRERILDLVRSNETLETEVKNCIGKIAYLEGRINGRK